MSKHKKQIREAFRNAVFHRDGYKCRVCSNGDGYILDVHHIVDRTEIINGGYVAENGISLCPDCHVKAEEYHISGGKNFVAGYHPEDLFKLIGSSEEKARRSSEKL